MVKVFSDRELVESLKKGNEAAITEIYHRYWRKLLAIAYNYTQDKNSAEELVQTVLVYLWDKRETLHIDSLPNYLAASVKYAALTAFRRERRRHEIAASVYANDQQASDDDEIYARFLQEFIDAEIDKLPEKCKLVFQFSRVQGKKKSEIASELNITEKTVEAHITRALKSLKISLRSIGFLFLLLINCF